MLRRDEYREGSVLNVAQRYYYLNGQLIGDVGNNGPSKISYAEEMAQQAATEHGDFRYGKHKLYGFTVEGLPAQGMAGVGPMSRQRGSVATVRFGEIGANSALEFGPGATTVDFVGARPVSGSTGYLNGARMSKSELRSYTETMNNMGVDVVILRNNEKYFPCLSMRMPSQMRGAFCAECEAIFCEKAQQNLRHSMRRLMQNNMLI